MRIPIAGGSTDNLYLTLRHLGYSPSRDEESYMRRLRGSLYPRFHLYVSEDSRGTVLNLHLDQKQPSYAGTSAHAGEYDGATVETEADRIRQAFV